MKPSLTAVSVVLVSFYVVLQDMLVAEGLAAQVTREGPVPVHLLHVSLQDLHVLQSFTADLTLHLLSVPWHQHLMGISQVLLVRFLPHYNHIAVRALHFKFFPPGFLG